MNYYSFLRIEEEDERSILYQDIYFINGNLTVLSSYPKEVFPVNKFTNLYTWKPEVLVVPNVDEYLSQYQFQEIELATYSDMLWISNIGHALFDDLYPIYLALAKFNLSDRKFDIIVNKWENFRERATEVVKDFCRGEIIELSVAPTLHIKNLIAGTGRCGNRVIREDYTLCGEIYNGINRFRERILSTYNISLSPINRLPRVAIIDNKRFTVEERKEIDKVIENLQEKKVDIQYIYWQNYLTFKDQLVDVADIDIYVSAPGNGIMYVPLLKNGAVIVNLGWMERTQTNSMRPNLVIPNATRDYTLPGFMEQSVCVASNASTLYYDRYKYNNIEEYPLTEIIEKAIRVVIGEESPPINNHNIDAQIFIEYCKRNNKARELCDYLTGKALFIEFFINEHPDAIPTEIVDLALLRELKEEYHYDRRYEIIL